jgi:catechol-2,3-dioxygenase
MIATAEPKTAPNLMFSHMGLSVTDIAKMEAFYTNALGFTVTDRGEAAGMQIVFLSRNPYDHHQIVLATGRPDNIREHRQPAVRCEHQSALV